jgi:hypothetical protein
METALLSPGVCAAAHPAKRTVANTIDAIFITASITPVMAKGEGIPKSLWM